MSKDDVKPPVTGDLRVWVSEAKNLGIARFRDFLQQGHGRQATSDRLQVGFEFRAPDVISDVFKSVFVDESKVEEFTTSIKNTGRFIDHLRVDNPTWRTPENPAGAMVDLGRMIQMPKCNALLRVRVSSEYNENGDVHRYEHGVAE